MRACICIHPLNGSISDHIYTSVIIYRSRQNGLQSKTPLLTKRNRRPTTELKIKKEGNDERILFSGRNVRKFASFPPRSSIGIDSVSDAIVLVTEDWMKQMWQGQYIEATIYRKWEPCIVKEVNVRAGKVFLSFVNRRNCCEWRQLRSD